MDRPTYSEARPLWRRTGDVETWVPPGMSVAERRARARQAGAPASQPPVTMQTARRTRSDRPMAPVQRKLEGAEMQTAVPSPRPAPPPERSHASTGASQAILDVLAEAGRPMWPQEVAAVLEGHANVGVLMTGLRKRGALVQDVKPGPYRLPGAEPVPAPAPAPAAVSISAPSNEAAKVNTPPENTHANLVALVTQLRNERDALALELSEMQARWRVMAREMHLLGAQWGGDRSG